MWVHNLANILYHMAAVFQQQYFCTLKGGVLNEKEKLADTRNQERPSAADLISGVRLHGGAGRI